MLLVLSTWVFCHGFAADVGQIRSPGFNEDCTTSEFIDVSFTKYITVSQEDPRTDDKQGSFDKDWIAYVRLGLTERQERLMRFWGLMPLEEQHELYEIYAEEKLRYQAAKANMSKSARLNVQQTSTSNASPMSSEPTVTGAIQPTLV